MTWGNFLTCFLFVCLVFGFVLFFVVFFFFFNSSMILQPVVHTFLETEISLAKTFGKSSASAKDANFLKLPIFQKGLT